MPEQRSYAVTDWMERYEIDSSGRETKPDKVAAKLRKRSLDFIRSKIHGREFGPGLRRLKAIVKEPPDRQDPDLWRWAAFGIFHKLLEIAGNEPADLRGIIWDDRGRPATAKKLAFLLDFENPKILAEILNILEHPDLDWIRSFDAQILVKLLDSPDFQRTSRDSRRDFRGIPLLTKLNLTKPNSTEPNETQQEERRAAPSNPSSDLNSSLVGDKEKTHSNQTGIKNGAGLKLTSKQTAECMKQVFVLNAVEILRASKHAPRSPEQLRQDFQSLKRLAIAVIQTTRSPVARADQFHKLLILLEEKYEAAAAGHLDRPYGAFTTAARRRYPEWTKTKTKTRSKP